MKQVSYFWDKTCSGLRARLSSGAASFVVSASEATSNVSRFSLIAHSLRSRDSQRNIQRRTQGKILPGSKKGQMLSINKRDKFYLVNYVGFSKQKSLQSFKTIFVNNFKTAFGLVSHVANRMSRYKSNATFVKQSFNTVSYFYLRFFFSHFLKIIIIWGPDAVDIADF